MEQVPATLYPCRPGTRLIIILRRGVGGGGEGFSSDVGHHDGDCETPRFLKHASSWGGGGCHVGVFWSAGGAAPWPIATYCPSLGPSPSARGSAHRPFTILCPLPPCLAYPYLPTPPSVPSSALSPRTGPLSLLHVGSTRRRASRHWPGASQWAPPSRRWGTPAQRRVLGPGMST